MPAAKQDADGLHEKSTVGHALDLLERALEIIDHWGDCPEIGARLQHVIDSVEERRRLH